jgi:hypothetical protein
MSKSNNEEALARQQLAVELDLQTASNSAFYDAIEKFYTWSETQPPVRPLQITNGWHTVTPLMMQDFLRRNVSNRKPTLATVRRYHYSMVTDDWRKTGQGLVFDEAGKMNEGQQRGWACYFGKVSFETYIVTDAPVQEDMFAYYDDVKPRSAADALQTSGLNGIANHISMATQISYRYENDALGILKQPKIHRLNNREVLEYSRRHPSLTDVGHMIIATYGKAVALIHHKGVAIFFADRVIAVYGREALDSFMMPLGSGANLEEDSPILGLRNRFLGEDRISRERCLALMIKAFNYHRDGKKMPKGGLYVRDNEKFPRLEAPVETSAD